MRPGHRGADRQHGPAAVGDIEPLVPTGSTADRSKGERLHIADEEVAGHDAVGEGRGGGEAAARRERRRLSDLGHRLARHTRQGDGRWRDRRGLKRRAGAAECQRGVDHHRLGPTRRGPRGRRHRRAGRRSQRHGAGRRGCQDGPEGAVARPRSGIRLGGDGDLRVARVVDGRAEHGAIGRRRCRVDPSDPSPKTSMAPGVSVVTPGDSNPIWSADASTGLVGSTPEKAMVTIDTWVAGFTATLGAASLAPATVTQAANRIP